MSTTSTERRESMGIVGDALRRPIQEAVKEGVKEAIREDETIRVRRGDRESRGRRGQEQSDDGGGRGGKFTMLVLLGVGMAAFVLWRRQKGGPGGVTQSIREQSKTGHAGESDPGSTQRASGMTEAAETARESTEAEDAAPGAGTE